MGAGKQCRAADPVTEANISPYLGRNTAAVTLAQAAVACPASGDYLAGIVDVATPPTCGAFDAVTHNAVLP